MVTAFIQISKYLVIILFAVYTSQSFSSLSSKKPDSERKALFASQRVEIFLITLVGFLDILLEQQQAAILVYFLLAMALFICIQSVYSMFYHNAPRILLNHMCMFLCIGMVMLTRLDQDLARKQAIIAIVSALATLLIPVIIKKANGLDKLGWVYAGIGIVSLGAVAVLGSVSYGAKLSLSIGGFSLQLSEFVKIIFVFFVASMFSRATDRKTILLTTVVAMLHVLILVASTDLGAALLFFMVYLVMLYVSTRKARYLLGGLLLGAVGSVAAYFLFYHVRVRVQAWKDPFSVIETGGYQLSQSLFAIGSGGWFGTGIGLGRPDLIPVVEQDFIFSAISEELGAIFAICLVLVCLCCFFIILNIAMQIHRPFYKLVALGLGTDYIFQVFLTVGGVTKFIPSTGVTLPFVSYGGSSVLSTFILFNIILGLYLFRESEYGHLSKEKFQKAGPASQRGLRRSVSRK